MAKKNYLKLIVALVFSSYFLIYATQAKDLNNWNLLDNVDLIIHEAGHVIFMFFGQFLNILGGSLFQILIPVVFALYFFIWRKENFSGSLLLFWIGQNIINVAIYMGDSIKQELPLLGGDNVIHDWNYILSSLGLLKYTDILATITYNGGFLVIIVGAVFSFYFAWYNMKYEPNDKKNT